MPSTIRTLLLVPIAIATLACTTNSEAQPCAAEGEKTSDGGCCEGLATDFSATCLPCVPQGEEQAVDGAGCCEGLDLDRDTWRCEPPSGQTSGAETEGTSASTTTTGAATTSTGGSTASTDGSNEADPRCSVAEIGESCCTDAGVWDCSQVATCELRGQLHTACGFELPENWWSCAAWEDEVVNGNECQVDCYRDSLECLLATPAACEDPADKVQACETLQDEEACLFDNCGDGSSSGGSTSGSTSG